MSGSPDDGTEGGKLGGRDRGRVLVVDDDAVDRTRLAATLRAAGHDVVELNSAEQALAFADREMPTLVVLEASLPGISGYQLCCELKDRFGAAVPVVFASRSRTAPSDRAAGVLVGGDEYLIKPVAPDELLVRVQQQIDRAAAFLSAA